MHKAVKYGVWSSTKIGNNILDKAFKSVKEQGGTVYLIFSVNGSGRFSGIAKMTSEVDFTKAFVFWTQDSKYNGMFGLEFLLLKDVTFKKFLDLEIKLQNGEIKPVTHSRDTQEIPFYEAVQMITTFGLYGNINSVLEHFEYYDVRQENYEKSMQLKGAE